MPIPFLVPIAVTGLAALLLAGGGGGGGSSPAPAKPNFDPNPKPDDKPPEPKPDDKPPEPDVPEPEDDVVLCDVDLGDYIQPDGTLGSLAIEYGNTPAAAWGTTMEVGGAMRRWGAAAIGSAVKLLGGKEESRWPLCWGGGDVPPAGWGRLDWAATLAFRDLIVKLVKGEDTFVVPESVGNVSMANIAAALYQRTPEGVRNFGSYKVPQGASYVTSPVDAVGVTLYRMLVAFFNQYIAS